MDLRIRVFLLFVLFMFVLSPFGIYFYWTSAVGILGERTSEYLDAIAEAKADHISYYLQREIDGAITLSRDHHFSDILLGLPEIDPIYGEFDIDHYQEVLGLLVDKEHEIFILNMDGIIVTSNNPDNIGDDKSLDDYFLGVFGKDYYIKDAYYSDTANRNIFTISVPIENPNTGDVLGFLVSRFDMNLLNEVTKDRTGLGVTGEAYLINKDGYILTDSRQGKLIPLQDKVDSFRSRECIDEFEEDQREENMEEEVVFYDNYNGKSVLGVDAHVSQINWCLLVEIGEEEAMGELKKELLLAGLKISIIAILLMLVFIFAADKILLKE